MRKVQIVVLIIGAAAALAACSGEPSVVDTPAVETSVVDTPAVEGSVEELQVTSNAVFTPDAPILTEQFSSTGPGQYRSDVLGTPVSFELTGDWHTQVNEPTFLVLSHPLSVGPDDRDIVFIRPRGLAEPTDPSAFEDGDSWDLADIDGWIANLIPTVEVTNRHTVKLGDRTAERFDITLTDDVECGIEFCVGFVEATTVNGKAFQRNSQYRIYWVEDEQGPVVVVVGSTKQDADWLTVADEFMSTVAFGGSFPHPAPTEESACLVGISCEAGAGTVTLPVAGGLSFELAEPRLILQGNGIPVVRLDGPGGLLVFPVASDADGNLLETVDDIVDHLVANGFTTSDVALDLPFEAVVLNMSSQTNPKMLKPDASLDRAWGPEQFTRLWILDTPRGPIAVSAEGQASVEEAALALAESILPTLRLVDLDG